MSFAGTFDEAVSLMDHKAIVIAQSCLRKGCPIPESFSHHLFILQAKSLLPYGIYLSRDEPWENNEKFPMGHHTINTLITFESGLKYVEGPLKALNALGKLVARLEYSMSKSGEMDECIIKRTDEAIIDGAAEKFEILLADIKNLLHLLRSRVTEIWYFEVVLGEFESC